MPRIYRDVLVLRDFDELTVQEIACRLHLEREAVKSRLRRARALLREYWGWVKHQPSRPFVPVG